MINPSPKKRIAITAIVFLVFLIIPASIGSMYYRISETIRNQTLTQLNTEGNIAASAIQIKLNRLVGIASSLATSNKIISAATGGSWTTAADVARDVQNNVAFYDTYIDRIVFADKTGVEQSAYPTLEGGIGADLSHGDWYTTMMQDSNSVVVSSVTKRRATPVLNVVNIAAPIKNDGNIVGFVVLQIPTSNFLEFGYALSTGTYGLTYVVDSNGNIVAHPKYSGGAGVINISSTLPVNNLVNRQSGVLTTDNGNGDGKDVVTYKVVSNYNWGVVIQEPYNEAFASYESIMRTFMVVEAILLLIDILLSYLIFRFLGSRKNPSGPLQKNSGFTLIELLVVIAIIAILSIVVILTMNPAEMLRQSRDSNRISDLSTLKSAVSLYLVDAANPNIASSTGGYSACYLSTVTGQGTSTAHCGIFTNTGGVGVSTTATLYRKNDSTGWLPVNFSQISLGTPLASLPVDPINNANNYYAYAATTTGGYYFEFDTFMESKKYGASGANDVVTKDGGDSATAYEVGNYPSLSL